MPEVFGASRGSNETTVLKLSLKIVIVLVILLLNLAICICVERVYVSSLVLRLLTMMIALLSVVVLATYSTQKGFIPLIIAFLIRLFGLPKIAFLLLGKEQDFRYLLPNVIYR